MNLLKMTDLDLSGKRVLIRQDLNVPIKNGEITSDTRIVASLPTISHAIKAGAKVMIMSHLGRPNAGEFDDKYSLKPVAKHLSDLLGQPVTLLSNWLDGVEMNFGEVVLCENVRFNEGDVAINPSGGLKSKGHPLGATGTGQAVEIFKQLKGTVEAPRQIRDAEIGLTHNVGGSGATCAVHIFGRDR